MNGGLLLLREDGRMLWSWLWLLREPRVNTKTRQPRLSQLYILHHQYAGSSDSHNCGYNHSKTQDTGDPQTQVSYTMFSVLCIGPYSSFSSCRLFAIPGRACVCLVFLYVL
ncbi:unnamed protein product [Penicillium camemberti]|uniref:Str. FM013 n=1 Tax=Penicillium camemberti (strain FM 013) TaxID=1429867 RepID=A0A0G4PES8_PENC3|nr:unnamed protein product [Penicillium camemberti]